MLGSPVSGGRKPARPRQRPYAVKVPAVVGVLLQLPSFGLLAPVQYVKKAGGAGGHANLSVGQANGTISCAVALATGAVQTINGTATGADGCVITWTATFTGALQLGALTLSINSLNLGVPVAINILGATAGSVLSADLPAVLVLNSAARTITGTPTEPGSYDVTLLETLAGAIGSPRTSELSLAVINQTWLELVTPPDFLAPQFRATPPSFEPLDVLVLEMDAQQDFSSVGAVTDIGAVQGVSDWTVSVGLVQPGRLYVRASTYRNGELIHQSAILDITFTAYANQVRANSMTVRANSMTVRGDQ